MILSPDDHRSLQAIDSELATCEPHLAAMLRIFSRLNAEEAPPPSEDLIVAIPPPAAAPASPGPRRGWRGRRRSRAPRARPSAPARTSGRSRPAGRPGRVRRGLWRPVAAIAVPVALLVTLLILMVVTLTSTMKCRPASAAAGSAARSSAPLLPGNAGLAGCQPSTGTGKTAARG
jgi:hypothetical protein